MTEDGRQTIESFESYCRKHAIHESLNTILREFAQRTEGKWPQHPYKLIHALAVRNEYRSLCAQSTYQKTEYEEGVFTHVQQNTPVVCLRQGEAEISCLRKISRWFSPRRLHAFRSYHDTISIAGSMPTNPNPHSMPSMQTFASLSAPWALLGRVLYEGMQYGPIGFREHVAIRAPSLTAGMDTFCELISHYHNKWTTASGNNSKRSCYLEQMWCQNAQTNGRWPVDVSDLCGTLKQQASTGKVNAFEVCFLFAVTDDASWTLVSNHVTVSILGLEKGASWETHLSPAPLHLLFSGVMMNTADVSSYYALAPDAGRAGIQQHAQTYATYLAKHFEYSVQRGDAFSGMLDCLLPFLVSAACVWDDANVVLEEVAQFLHSPATIAAHHVLAASQMLAFQSRHPDVDVSGLNRLAVAVAKEIISASSSMELGLAMQHLLSFASDGESGYPPQDTFDVNRVASCLHAAGHCIGISLMSQLFSFGETSLVAFVNRFCPAAVSLLIFHPSVLFRNARGRFTDLSADQAYIASTETVTTPLLPAAAKSRYVVDTEMKPFFTSVFRALLLQPKWSETPWSVILSVIRDACAKYVGFSSFLIYVPFRPVLFTSCLFVCSLGLTFRVGPRTYVSRGRCFGRPCSQRRSRTYFCVRLPTTISQEAWKVCLLFARLCLCGTT
jgi:hypothetical protein